MTRNQGTAGLFIAAALFLLNACDNTPVEPVQAPLPLTAVEHPNQETYTHDNSARARRRWLRKLRRATRPFRRYSVAESAGYDVQATGCEESEAGGMGYHFANFDLLDGVLEETRPEILLYAPVPGGGEKLVAVEYAIPYTEWDREDEPPQIHGVSFNRNDVFNLWVLHVWAWKYNPEGTFEGWNPRVSCDVED